MYELRSGSGATGQDFTVGDLVVGQSFGAIHFDGAAGSACLTGVTSARHACVGSIEIVSEGRVEDRFAVFGFDHVFFPVKFKSQSRFHGAN